MLKRTISGAVLLAVMIALVAAGGKIMLAGLFLMSMVGLYEFYKAVREGGHRPFSIVGLVMCFLYFLVLLLWPDELMGSSLHQSLLIAFFLVLMILTVIGYPGRRIEDTALSFAGFVYVAVFFACMYVVRNMQDGAYVVWYIFIASWGCDTCAYLAGRFFRNHLAFPEEPARQIPARIWRAGSSGNARWFRSCRRIRRSRAASAALSARLCFH